MAAELVVVKGKNRGDFVKINDAPVTIGRAKTANLTLCDDSKVSHVHARITPMEGDRWLLEDLGSTNGTYVNDERVEQIPLRQGDLVRIGRSLLIFRADGTSSVHLSDVKLEGGGSSHDIKAEAVRPSAPTPPPRYDARPVAPQPGEAHAQAQPVAPGRPGSPEPAGSSGPRTMRLSQTEDDSAVEAERARGGAFGLDLLELVLAADASDLQTSLDRLARVVLEGTGSKRAFVFLRHPLSGGLGRAAARCRGGASPEQPVDARLLTRGASGDVTASEVGAVAPVRALGKALGAVYVDGMHTHVDGPARIQLLTAAGVIVGLLAATERSRRIGDAAIEVVSLAAERVQKRPVDLAAALAATERVYQPAARQRGLGWSLTAPPTWAQADPLLLGRGLDRLIEHVLSVARGDVQLGCGLQGPVARLWVSRPLVESPEAVARLVDPEGVAADLRRAQESLGDGGLCVARVSLLRAGGRFQVLQDGARVVHALDLEPAAPGPGP